MKKGVEYTGVVTKLGFPNKGEVDCREDGVATVKGTIPGQTVWFQKKEQENPLEG